MYGGRQLLTHNSEMDKNKTRVPQHLRALVYVQMIFTLAIPVAYSFSDAPASDFDGYPPLWVDSATFLAELVMLGCILRKRLWAVYGYGFVFLLVSVLYLHVDHPTLSRTLLEKLLEVACTISDMIAGAILACGILALSANQKASPELGETFDDHID